MLRQSLLSAYPNRVTLELTNRCNRSCKGCPRLKTDYPQGDISLQLLDRIVSQLPPQTVIVPFFRGESMLHPSFADIMKRLQKFTDVQLATNGDFLTSELITSVLDTVSTLSLSLHSYRLPEPTEPFLMAKKDGVTTQVSIVSNMLTGDKQAFIDAWLRYVDRVRIYMPHSLKGFGDTGLPLGNWGDPCIKPFTDMVVYWDGKVALCNHDWNRHNSLGDLNEESIEDVWHGEQYNNIRRAHQNGHRKLIHSCQDCDYWMTSYLDPPRFGELYTKKEMIE